METIEEVVDRLRGSCDNFDVTLYSLDDLKYLDSEIFNCTVCGWWCEMGDLSAAEEDLVCVDCYIEEQE